MERGLGEGYCYCEVTAGSEVLETLIIWRFGICRGCEVLAEPGYT